MCSIFGIFGLQPGDDIQALRRQSLDCSQRQRHRGPDWSGVYLDDGAILVHERLGQRRLPNCNASWKSRTRSTRNADASTTTCTTTSAAAC